MSYFLYNFDYNAYERGEIMSQITFSVRMDEDLKRQFDSLCQEFGMNTTTAINVFARATVRERKIPFEITAPQTTREGALKAFESLRQHAQSSGIADLTLEEINKEIALARKGH